MAPVRRKKCPLRALRRSGRYIFGKNREAMLASAHPVSWRPVSPYPITHGVSFQHLGISMDAMSENKMVPSELSTGPVEKAAKPLPFKDPNFVHSGHGGAVAGKKNRTWKNLKQILASERALPWQLNDPNYFSIDAPPSFKPAKKYSDVSGLLWLHQFISLPTVLHGTFSLHACQHLSFVDFNMRAILTGVR
ncbi:INO80 complex subunit C isoform X5 [Lepus europaeus]|uniref:INO80 complex subunit C isoform X5 n=1 Tax=Lepus europaeus TaxID=9983 RepID=UPI002B47BC78|nr:INO80 complex subunit C isoform X5 [Lepus europaeus]